MAQKARKIPRSTRFEDALAELEGLVRELEDGEQTLEVSLERFERGVSLARFCRESLDAAEQQVRILTAAEDGGDDASDTPDTDEGLPFGDGSDGAGSNT